MVLLVFDKFDDARAISVTFCAYVDFSESIAKASSRSFARCSPGAPV
jgi:hypothetical protein